MSGTVTGHSLMNVRDIANSDKRLGEDKGFRGIGRLCGLAYCKELIFTSKAAGEDVISIMHCDAAKMRKIHRWNSCRIIHNTDSPIFCIKPYINTSFFIPQKAHIVSFVNLIASILNILPIHTASEVLHSIYKFEYPHTDNIDAHSFKVELVGINEENTDLLDFAQIKEYLSFVAPVPYQNTFIFRSEIYKYAKELNYHIDEYTIRLEGEQIFKKYKTNFTGSMFFAALVCDYKFAHFRCVTMHN